MGQDFESGPLGGPLGTEFNDGPLDMNSIQNQKSTL